jgi:competence protein ComEC
VALAAIAGILFTEYATPPPSALLAVTIAALLLAPWRRGLLPLWLATAGTFALAHLWQWPDAPARLWAAALNAEPRNGTVTGVLIDEPQEILRGTKPTGQWRARMRAESWQLGDLTAELRQPLIVRWATTATPRYGDRWTIEGAFSAPAAARNPGEFDAAAWYQRQGLFLELRTRDRAAARPAGENAGSAIQSAALASRAWIMNTLGLGLGHDPDVRAVIAGITLGAREEEAETFLPVFRQTGTLHLFAVSGLHVGMFGLLLWLVLRPLGLSRRQAILVIVPMLFFYALVTGAKPSSLRAATMISIALGGFLLDRPIAAGNSLAAAALVLLGWDTNQLFLPGFQLSFSVVASIILLTAPAERWLSARLQPDPFLPRKLYRLPQRWRATAGHHASGLLAVSSAAWLGSLPLTIGLFHLFPLVAIPANILAVPLAFCILSVSMLALAGGALSTGLAVIFNNTNWALTSILIAGVQWAAALPGAWFHLPPGWMQPPARLTVFDLSTGGAQLLRTPQAAWLFDAGTDYDAERIIDPALRAAGVGRLQTLVLTHGDNEHIGGAPFLIGQAPPQRLVESILRDRSRVRQSLHASLQSGGQPKTLVLPGDWLRAGRATTVQFLAPESKRRGRSADDQAIVARLDTGKFRALLMSDAGAGTENRLVQQAASDLRSDILVLGRHGDDIFATEEFLAAVQPRVVILGARDPFRRGDDEEVLRARLAATGAEVFAQAECGAVIATFAHDHMEVHGFLNDRRIVLPPRPAK